MIQRKHLLLLAALIGLVGASPTLAADNDTTTVNYSISAINELDISGASISLTINSATAGSEPDSHTDSSSLTYAITSNDGTAGAAKKVTGVLDAAMPTGTTLSLNLAAPGGEGSSAGAVTLSNTAQDLVTAIDAGVAASGVQMTFDFSATVAAGVVSGNRILTLTVTDA